MAGFRMMLDPAKTGPEALSLEENLRKRRPAGSLLFLGPTGSGKTRTVEAVAEALVGDRSAVVKIDCAEFQHSHEIAKLIGSPPGYLGHRETKAMLSQEALDQHHTDKVKLSFVLFDEIEKASDALWNLLLGVLDKATLTLGDNRRVDFSKSIIFMTSNLGAAEMNALLQPKLGFAVQTAGTQSPDKLARAGTDAVRRRFTPEFVNRIDKMVVFNALGEVELRQIVDLELVSVEDRIHGAIGANGIELAVADSAKAYMLKEGIDARYGARHLKRAIERLMVHPVSKLIATGQIQGNDRLLVEFDLKLARLVFMKECQVTEPQADGLAAAA